MSTTQYAIEGHCDPKYAKVRQVFAEHFEQHPAGGLPELGASVSVVVGGEAVVDLWGGFMDAARTQRWQRDTVGMVASCTKGLTALVAARLVDRGLLDPDALVSRYWPEYGQNGKERTTVWDVFTHRAGQPQLGVALPPGGLWDWDLVVQAFAEAAPQWEPGTAIGYHAFSFGHLAGELVRRVSGGRTVGQLLREEIAGPLGVDVLLGVRDDELERCAQFVAPPAESPFGALGHAGDATDFATLTRYDDMRLMSAAAANSLQWKRAAYPAAGAFTNARALATIYGALARGGGLARHGSGGIELIGKDTLARLSTSHASGPDRTLGAQSSFAFGWQTPSAVMPIPVLGPHSFGHPGGWGSLAWCDPDRELAFAYTMNQTWSLLGDPRSTNLYQAALT